MCAIDTTQFWEVTSTCLWCQLFKNHSTKIHRVSLWTLLYIIISNFTKYYSSDFIWWMLTHLWMVKDVKCVSNPFSPPSWEPTCLKIAPWGTVGYLSRRRETGHLTDEMESIQFECTGFCEALFWTPELKLPCVQVVCSNLFVSSF